MNETATESQGNGLATLAFLASILALPLGVIGALGAALLAHAAWGRCVRHPERRGRLRSMTALALSHLALMVAMAGVLSPPASGYLRAPVSVDPEVVAKQRDADAFKARRYEIIASIVAEHTDSAFALQNDDSLGFQRLQEMARAAGGDDVMFVRCEESKRSMFSTAVRKRYFGAAIYYRKK